jgi:DNA-binding transcriptional regulator YiaG
MSNSDHGERAALSPAQLDARMSALGINQATLARLVCVDKGAPGRWLSGEVPVPLWLAEHLAALIELRRLSVAVAGTLPPTLPAADPGPLSPRLQHLADVLYGDKSTVNKPIAGTSAMMNDMSRPEPNLSPEQFREALAGLGWKQADFVRRVGCATNTASRWAQGRTPIPMWVAAHLALLSEIQRLHERFVQPS